VVLINSVPGFGRQLSPKKVVGKFPARKGNIVFQGLYVGRVYLVHIATRLMQGLVNLQMWVVTSTPMVA
jgi:hypothetical protein